MAEQVDPLGRWSEIVRDARPATWWYLKGDARSALDMRLAAEMVRITGFSSDPIIRIPHPGLGVAGRVGRWRRRVP
jgi:hypothetical protein